MPGGAELAPKVRGSLLQVKEPLTAFGFGERLVSRDQLICQEWGGSHLISYQKLHVRKSGHLLEMCVLLEQVSPCSPKSDLDSTAERG